MHARHLLAASVVALLLAGCPRWEINGLVLEREESDVALEEPIKGAVVRLKCGEPPAVEVDAGTPPEGGLRWRGAGMNHLAADGGDDAGTDTDGGEDAGDGGTDAAVEPPNTGTEFATTGADGKFHLGNENEVGPHENCTVAVVAPNRTTRVYEMNKVCAHYEMHEGINRCQFGWVLVEMEKEQTPPEP